MLEARQGLPHPTDSTTTSSSTPTSAPTGDGAATSHSDGSPVTITQTWPAPNETNTFTSTFVVSNGAETTYYVDVPSSALSSSPTTTTSKPPASGSNITSASGSNITSGILAGAIVAAAIGAALIAFLVAFLIFRRRKTSYRRADNDEKPSSHPWEAYLPQSADDGSVRQHVEALYSQIDMHVENYYANKLALGEVSQSLLDRVDSGKLPASLASVITSASMPLPIIKHSFAWVILSQLLPAEGSESCLLPAEFARLPPKMTSSGRSKGGAKQDQSTSEAYDYWRVLTAHLLYPGSNKGRATAVHNASASECMQSLSAAFMPWSKADDAAASSVHLRNVLSTASETGLLLISQGSSFKFDWESGHEKTSTRSIVTFPTLAKVSDESGRRLVKQQILVEARIEAMSI